MVDESIKSKCLVIPDNSGYDINMFNIPVKYANFIKSILIPNGLVKDRTHKMAADILTSLPNCKSLVVLCVLKGGYKFCSELVDAMEQYICSCELNMSVKVEFIRLKSYHNVSSTGEVEVIGLSDLSELSGKDILIVEDIIDTGKTMTKALKLLQNYDPASVQCASLLLKRTPMSCGYVPEFTGFSVENGFIVGFGIDYNEFFRDLPVSRRTMKLHVVDHIAIINEAGIEHFKA